MSTSLKFLSPSMLPGGTEVILYSLLSSLGISLKFHCTNAEEEIVPFISIKSPNISNKQNLSNNDSVSDVVFNNGLVERIFRLPLDGHYSPKLVEEMLEMVEFAISFEKRNRTCISFDIEVTDLDLIVELTEFLEECAQDDMRLTLFFTGNVWKWINKKGLDKAFRYHEIGNHTSDHNETSSFNIREGHNLIRGENGSGPVCFRAPRLSLQNNLLIELCSMGYRFDSSFFGSIPFPILSHIQSHSVLTEVPLLDGGDYAYLHLKRMNQQEYESILARKLEYLNRFNTGFSLLFHPQYSNINVWRAARDIVKQYNFEILPLSFIGKDV